MKKSIAGGSGGASGSGSVPPKKSAQFTTVPPPPPNPTDNWRETDKATQDKMKEDKSNFAVRRTVGSVNHKDLATAIATASANPEKKVEEKLDTSKYVQCPHCGRKFDIVAGEKHIANCQNYTFNQGDKEKYRKSLRDIKEPPKK